MVKLFAAGVLAVLLAACGGGSDEPEGKSLFSIWTNTANGSTLDLRGETFGRDNVIALYPPSAIECLCRLAVVGTEVSGSFAITSCIVYPYDQRTDGQCKALNAAGNYTNENRTLTLSTSAGAATYQ